MSQQTIAYWDNASGDGVEFPFTRLDVESKPVFAADGIQQEATQYQFSVRGVLAANDLSTFAAYLAKFRAYLSRRGLEFIVYWTDESGNAYSPLWDFSGDGDVAWGPTPGVLRLTRFAGGLSAAYEWSVTVTQKECFSETCALTSPQQYILSVTKRVDSQIDLNGLTARTVSGRLTVTASSIKNGVTADAYRWYVEPVIPSWFKVTGRQYSCSEDGRILAYTVSMREQLLGLPNGMTDGRVSFTVRLQDNGLMALFSLSGYFEAPYTISKADIIATAISVAKAKLSKFVDNPTNPVFWTTQELTDPDLYDKNRIEFTFAGTFAAGIGVPGAVTNLLDTAAAIVDLPPNSAGAPNSAYPYGGDSGGGSGTSDEIPFYLYDACSSSSTVSDSITNGFTGDTLSPSEPGQTDDDQKKYSMLGGDYAGEAPQDSQASTEHKAQPYIAYHEEIHYCLDNGVEVFYPKRAGASPIVQQSRPPTMTIIQAGYSIRYAQNSGELLNAVPPPMGTKDSRVILTADIPASVPEPMGDGSYNRWTTHWRYVMRVLAPYTNAENVGAGDVFVQYPPDPRRETNSQQLVQFTSGSLIVDPSI